jgi:hypothetical protein
MRPELDFGQGKDIVAGSPTKLREAQDKEYEDGEHTPEEVKGREEMNGVIIYDSYAKLVGCEKIVEYFQNKTFEKINPNILFTKEETKQSVKDVFGDRARERDFASDQDRNLFRNLPRFSMQRDFSNP